jgi:hypothetical protein
LYTRRFAGGRLSDPSPRELPELLRTLAAPQGKKRCRMHGGAPGSGAPRANQNARKRGLFTRDAIAERRQIQALLGETRRFLRAMK